jgi:hypothetical protein
LAASCGFLLDFDELQKVSPDAGVIPGAGGTAGGNSTAGTAGTAGGGGATSVPLEQLASALAAAACANLNACYVSAVRVLIHDEDCQTLFTGQIQETTVAAIQQSVASGKITYDPVKAAECVANLTRGAQQLPPECANMNALLEACKLALGNLAAADQPCGQSAECQRGLLCRLDSGCPGACQPFGQVGASCQQNAECDPTQGLYCQQLAGDAGAPDAGTTDAGTPGTCQHYVALGDTCNQQQDQCVPGGFCVNGTCRRISDLFTLAEGFDCYYNNLLCRSGLACEFTGVPLVPLLSTAACVAENQPLGSCRVALPGECPKDYYCNATLLSLVGQCVAAPTENQPCAAALEQPVISAPCHSGLACVAGYCKPMRHLGQACEADAQCYSGACRAGADAGGLVCVTLGCP